MIGDNVIIKPEYLSNVNNIIKVISEQSLVWPTKYVIGIGGESGSGKSTTAIAFKLQLQTLGIACITIHQDDYFKLPPATNHKHREESFDNVGMQEVNLEIIASHIKAFKKGAPEIAKPIVNFNANTIETEILPCQQAKVLIVEGTYILNLPNIDFKVFINRTYLDTKEQRQIRAREEQSAFLEKVLAIEHSIIKEHKQLAQAIIEKDYSLIFV
jgi:uridine kinase